MKRYIKASQTSVLPPLNKLKQRLGISWHSDASLNDTDFGKCNFVLSPVRYGEFDADSWINKIKRIGGKYITKRHGNIYFYYDMTQLNLDYEAEKKQAEDDYNAELNAMDIDKYKPNQATINKLIEYRDRGSKVNVKAIKDSTKAMTYYYAARLIGWDDLCSSIWDAWMWEYSDLMTAISRRVANDASYADNRTDMEKKLDLPDSRGLFTFDGKNCWLPKSVLMFFINNNIPVHFGKRTSGAGYDRNGRDWTEIEHLTLFPDSDNSVSCDIAVTTDEGGGPSCFSAIIDGRRICDSYSSAKKLIIALNEWLTRNA